MVDDAARAVREFFVQSFEFKRNHGAGPGIGQKHGYMDLENVEVFEVKDHYDPRFQWPSENLRKSVCSLSSELKDASLKALKILCESAGMDWSAVEEKLDKQEKQPLEEASQTTLRCLLYSKPMKQRKLTEHAFQTGNHTDNSLVTVAPRATIKALELLPFDCDKVTEFMNVEEAMEENELCVFVGDSLGKLSGGIYPSVVHRPNEKKCLDAFSKIREDGKTEFEVEQLRRVFGRISFPFFLRARPDAVLNTMVSKYSNTTTDISVAELETNKARCREQWPWKNDEQRAKEYYKLQIFH